MLESQSFILLYAGSVALSSCCRITHSRRYSQVTNMGNHPDLAVVGAGILGLAHAYEAARRGRRVAVLERSPRAAGEPCRSVWAGSRARPA